MRLALLGYPINHSLSPSLYKEILGPKLTSYELLSFQNPSDIPSLEELKPRLDGLNITTPYKTHFLNDVVLDEDIQKLGCINTLSFTESAVVGTNTDFIAVKAILERYQKEHPRLNIILLGNGVMAKITTMIAENLNIDRIHLHRKNTDSLHTQDLTNYRVPDSQNLIINSCSRDFIFTGRLNREDIFWDYNYAFTPHSNHLPEKVKSYSDGQEMLKLQAIAAVEFWKQTNPKLNY